MVWWRRAEARQQPVRVRVAETQDPPVEQVGRHGEDGRRPDGVRLAEVDQADLDAGQPTRGDVRHRVNVALNTDLPGSFRVNASFRAQSGSPYNITTGVDANGDGIQNERPVGVTRNSARGTGTKNMDMTLTWRLSLGHRSPELPGGQRGPGSSRPASGNELFRFEVFARATNVLNLENPMVFSGVLTSPFFGLPTSAGTARRVVFGTRVWF